MVDNLRERFANFVDTSGEHHIWTGATRRDTGAGRMKVNGKEVQARQVAWELEHGPLAQGARVLPCQEAAACVRLDHLRTVGADGQPLDVAAVVAGVRGRSRRGGGSMRRVGATAWDFVVTAGCYDDGSPRRAYRRARAKDADDAARQLAAFVAEVHSRPPLPARDDWDITVDAALEQFLTEHLGKEKGRESKTVDDYRRLHRKWFSPRIGQRRVRDIDEAAIDAIFGEMRLAGLSRSRMSQAKSLYGPFFGWARSRRFTTRNPMVEFHLPTSRQVSRERTP